MAAAHDLVDDHLDDLRRAPARSRDGRLGAERAATLTIVGFESSSSRSSASTCSPPGGTPGASSERRRGAGAPAPRSARTGPARSRGRALARRPEPRDRAGRAPRAARDPRGSRRRAGAKLVESGLVREATVLATCNRVEVVAVADRGASDVAAGLTAARAAERAHAAGDRRAPLRASRQARARHLFRVTASLDSMISAESDPGPGQGAVPARGGGRPRPAPPALLRALLHGRQASPLRDRRRGEVRLDQLTGSRSSWRGIFDGLEDKTAMLIGAGKMAELAARHLLGQGSRA